jgi:hypothetical protein
MQATKNSAGESYAIYNDDWMETIMQKSKAQIREDIGDMKLEEWGELIMHLYFINTFRTSETEPRNNLRHRVSIDLTEDPIILLPNKSFITSFSTSTRTALVHMTLAMFYYFLMHSDDERCQYLYKEHDQMITECLKIVKQYQRDLPYNLMGLWKGFFNANWPYAIQLEFIEAE